MSATDKLHRWLDIIAALLARRYPVTLTELLRDVPGYADDDVKPESVLRKFERDKEELRDLGVVIDTEPDADGVSRYHLSRGEFYLPLLSVSATLLPEEAELRQQPVANDVYRGSSSRLGMVVLTPDECHALRRAAARVSALGHTELVADAAQALRKLQFELEEFADELPAAQLLRVDGDVFDVLTDAVALRKRLSFTYHSMERNDTATRDVFPYGLVFLTGHWYLVAHDVPAEAMRQFRVSRIREAKMAARPHHPDFDVPADFDLTRYAASRRAWQLGNGEEETIVVHFHGDSGLVSQAAELGEPVSDTAAGDGTAATRADESYTRRQFGVRRRDTFLRWLLSFGGAARPIAPPEVVHAWRDLLLDTRAAQMSAPVHATAASVEGP